MQERFTKQAKKALRLAQTISTDSKHNYIGTEHILMGLIKGDEEKEKMVLEEYIK